MASWVSAALLLIAGAALANDKKADPLPAEPLLADPLLTNPLLITRELQQHCWGGAACGEDRISTPIASLDDPPPVTVPSVDKPATDFLADIVVPTAAIATQGNATAGGGGSNGFATMATLSRGGLSARSIIASSVAGGLGAGSVQPLANPVRGTNRIVPAAATTATSATASTEDAGVVSAVATDSLADIVGTTSGPLSELAAGTQAETASDLLVGFLSTASATSPNFSETGDIVLAAAREPSALMLFLSGLVVLGAAGSMRVLSRKKGNF